MRMDGDEYPRHESSRSVAYKGKNVTAEHSRRDEAGRADSGGCSLAKNCSFSVIESPTQQQSSK